MNKKNVLTQTSETYMCILFPAYLFSERYVIKIMLFLYINNVHYNVAIVMNRRVGGLKVACWKVQTKKRFINTKNICENVTFNKKESPHRHF